MNRTNIAVLITLVLGGGFLFLLITNKNNTNNLSNQKVTLPIHIEEFLDYNCSHCAEFEPTMVNLKKTFGDKIEVQQKNLPILTEISSSNSVDSSALYAYAAEAARLQNKFDEYSLGLFKWNTYLRDPKNTIYEYSNDEKTLYGLGSIDVNSLAQSLKLDINKFNTDISSDYVKNIVKSQKTDAFGRLGSPSTPAVFINGVYLSNYPDINQQISDLIQRAQNNK